MQTKTNDFIRLEPIGIKERPILFSSEMVRAILEGRKTQIRRPLRVQPLDVLPFTGDQSGRKWVTLETRDPNHGKVIACRYGVPGDKLWVRETWATPGNYDDVKPRDLWKHINKYQIVYRASEEYPVYYHWRPSIHMPHWISRIILKIINVRLERLNLISRNDVTSEGITHSDPSEALWQFVDLWDRINAKRGYSWDSNPWVWAITFEPYLLPGSIPGAKI